MGTKCLVRTDFLFPEVAQHILRSPWSLAAEGE